MPATYRTSSAGGGTSGTGNRSITITPAVNDLLIVFVKWSGNSATNPTCTDDNGSGTYSLILTALNNASGDIMAVFVRTALMANTTSTVITPVVGSGSNTAGEIVVIHVAGMSRVGAAAIRQSGKQENQTSGVPTPVLPANALTTNMTIQAAGSTTTAGAVPNASWTERQDASQATPTTALEVATRDSGFTGTSAAAVSIASSVWCSAILELDGSIASTLTASMSTFSGAMAKQGGKVLPASMSTFDAALARLTKKALAGSMSTFSAVLVASHLFLKSLTASMSTFSGDLARRTGKALAGSMSTFSGGLARLTSRALAAGMSTFSAALVASHLFAVSLSASMSTFAGSLARSTGKDLPAGMSTFAGGITRRTGKALAAGMGTFSGALAASHLFAVALTASMSTFAGGLGRRTSRALDASLATFSGDLARATSKSLTAGMSTFSAGMNKVTNKVLVAATSTMDALLDAVLGAGAAGPGRFTLAAIRLRPQLAAQLDLETQLGASGLALSPRHRVRDLKLRGDD